MEKLMYIRVKCPHCHKYTVIPVTKGYNVKEEEYDCTCCKGKFIRTSALWILLLCSFILNRKFILLYIRLILFGLILLYLFVSHYSQTCMQFLFDIGFMKTKKVRSYKIPDFLK